MAQISASDINDATFFTRTFIPGGFVFPSPRYSYSVAENSVTYTHNTTSASTGYFNILPKVTLSGTNLRVDENGRANGTVTELVFSSQNRGEIARITDIRFSATDFLDVLDARLSGDNTSSSQFEELLAEILGSSLTLSNHSDEVLDISFIRHLDTFDLAGGNDHFSLSSFENGSRMIDGGSGRDTLDLRSLGRVEGLVVNLANHQIVTDTHHVQINSFEIIQGDFQVTRYIGSDRGDTIYAAGREDAIFGHGGRDLLEGGFGDDRIFGGSGADRLRGEEGHDRLFGGTGGDRLNGGSGDDTLRAHSGADTLRGGAGDDNLFGGSGNDLLFANSGNNVLHGQSGHDDLYAGSGRNMLFGGKGNDQLVDGAGFDILNGGDGADDFVFSARNENNQIRDLSFEENDQITLISTQARTFDQDSLRLTTSGFTVDFFDTNTNTIEQMRFRLASDFIDDLTLSDLSDHIQFT